MKKMEFMRAAAKELMDFFSELYVENEFTSQNINLKKQQGSFKIKYSGGTLSFFTYMTGTISYCTSSFIGSKSDYKEYYSYSPDDDHDKVIEKFRSDLNMLKDRFYSLFMEASFESDPFRCTVFEYAKPFESSLSLNNEDEDDELEEE